MALTPDPNSFSDGHDFSSPDASPFNPDEAKEAGIAAGPRSSLPQPHFGWAILVTLCAMGFQAVVGMVLVVSVIVFGPPSEELPAWVGVAMIPLGTLATLLVALMIVAACFGLQAPRRISWRQASLTQWLLVAMTVIPMQVVASEVVNWGLEVRQLLGWDFMPNVQVFMLEFLQQSWPLVFVGGCLLPGLGEEILFRGYVGRGMIARHGYACGVLGTSFLFAAMHLDPIQASGAFVLGVGLHYLLLCTGSLLAPIFVHIANNSLAFLAASYSDRFPLPGINVDLGGNNVSHTPLIVLLTAAASLIALFAALFQTRTQWLLPTGDAWSPGYRSVEIPDSAQNCRASQQPLGLALALGVLATFVVFLMALYSSHLLIV